MRHVGPMGAGLFGTTHFINNGYNRSIVPASPLQSLSNPNTALYNVANNLKPFLSPMATGNPVHPLSPDFGLLSSVGSQAASSAAAMAMQAAAAQAATYQNSLKSASHFLHEMRNTNLENVDTNKTSSIMLASLSHHYGNQERLSQLPCLSTSKSSSSAVSATSKDAAT